jgi:predicted thioesterase
MTDVEIVAGRHARLSFVVGADDLATALGSGDVPVLATPRVLAWLEAATVAALDGVLTAGSTSVGTRVELEHLAPSRVGDTLTVEASVTHVDGRLVRFDAAATTPDGPTLATARITRVVVDRARFLAR